MIELLLKSIEGVIWKIPNECLIEDFKIAKMLWSSSNFTSVLVGWILISILLGSTVRKIKYTGWNLSDNNPS